MQICENRGLKHASRGAVSGILLTLPSALKKGWYPVRFSSRP